MRTTTDCPLTVGDMQPDKRGQFGISIEHHVDNASKINPPSTSENEKVDR